MGRIKYAPELKRYVRRYNLGEKLSSIFYLLNKDAQGVVDWAYKESKRKQEGKKPPQGIELGKTMFHLLGRTAAIRLVQQNHSRGRLTTKSEVRLKTGQKMEMPVLYQEAGLRHPQEARNLRHNLFHEAFLALITHLFPNVETSVPSTGEGLTPDLMVKHKKPDWTISVEYKGYRSITLLSESEILKGMRYQAAYGTAWLVTSTTKDVSHLYGTTITSEEVIERGLARLRSIAKRRVYTSEQKENKGIARKGISHLQKHINDGLRCKVVSAADLLDSCKAGKPLKGLAVTTGLDFVDMLRDVGMDKHSDNVLRIMKTPARSIHSDTVTSVRLIG
ncbi:MAG: hypothetical protein ACXAEE_08920 [Candidatus Thorarchaeota archaeon]